MSDPTPTELIAEARDLGPGGRWEGDVMVDLADALEAQLAEAARLQAVIDAGIRRAGELIDNYDDINYDEDNFDAGQFCAANDIRNVLVSADSSSALEAADADTTSEEAEAVARLTHIIAGWDYENPEDDTEEDVKYIHLDAAAYVEAARLARSGSSAADAARRAADLIPRGDPVETEGDRK